ncbi:hypothetical protein [Pseudomonas putida]
MTSELPQTLYNTGINARPCPSICNGTIKSKYHTEISKLQVKHFLGIITEKDFLRESKKSLEKHTKRISKLTITTRSRSHSDILECDYPALGHFTIAVTKDKSSFLVIDIMPEILPTNLDDYDENLEKLEALAWEYAMYLLQAEEIQSHRQTHQ